MKRDGRRNRAIRNDKEKVFDSDLYLNNSILERTSLITFLFGYTVKRNNAITCQLESRTVRHTSIPRCITATSHDLSPLASRLKMTKITQYIQ